MKSFAGFWRDGAVAKPEEDHWKKRSIVACWKDSEWYEVLSDRFANWHQVYWLDTTTPTELSPQEAFECHEIIWPSAKKIIKSHDGYYFDCGNGKPIINWGDLTEYPPKQRWRVPTDEDKGKKCRFGDDSSYVRDGMFLCVHPNGRFVVYYDRDFWLCKFCEVQDEA